MVRAAWYPPFHKSEDEALTVSKRETKWTINPGWAGHKSER
jgi:hypothetical protein